MSSKAPLQRQETAQEPLPAVVLCVSCFWRKTNCLHSSDALTGHLMVRCWSRLLGCSRFCQGKVTQAQLQLRKLQRLQPLQVLRRGPAAQPTPLGAPPKRPRLPVFLTTLASLSLLHMLFIVGCYSRAHLLLSPTGEQRQIAPDCRFSSVSGFTERRDVAAGIPFKGELQYFYKIPLRGCSCVALQA